MTAPLAVLVGPPGAGKSTVGRALAHLWGVPLRDTDRDVERTAGATVSDIFVTSGEDEFRALERQAVATALAEHAGVLALGAGAVLDAETRRDLTGRPVAHLDVGLAAAMSRLSMNRSRPLLVGNVRAQWQRLAEQRRPLYLEVATVTVLTDSLTADQVARQVAAELERRHATPLGADGVD